jgi:hypothetical protein
MVGRMCPVELGISIEMMQHRQRPDLPALEMILPSARSFERWLIALNETLLGQQLQRRAKENTP